MAKAKDIKIGGGSNASTSQPLDRFDFPHPAHGKGAPPVTMENMQYLLDNSGFTVGYDVIKKRMSVRKDGKPANELDIVSCAARYRMQGPWLLAYVEQIARDNPLNPVRDWIDSTPWDGRDRFNDLLATLQLAEDYPPELARALLYRWLLSCAAAAVLEGRRFSARGVLTLQGPQGKGKTSWIGKLINDPVLRDEVIKRDHHMDGGNKDSILSATSHLIVEIGELDGAFRKDIARLKGFLTNDCDKIRPPYGKTEIEMPRRTVFAATVNDATFLVDPTGNSRFWTIAVESLDYNHDIDMQQLFAQLKLEIERREQWWLTPEEEQALADYNLRHRAVSAIAERIKDHIDVEASGSDAGTHMSPIQLLKDLGLSNPKNSECKECGGVLRELFGEPRKVNGRVGWRIVRRDDFQPDKAMTPVRSKVDPKASWANPLIPHSRPEDEF